MKKIVAIMLVFALTLSMVACKAKEAGKTEKDNSNEQTQETQEKEKEELENVSIKLTYPGNHQEDEEKVEKAINEYLKDKINISIDIDPIDWSAFREKTNLMMATGEELDLVFTADWFDYATNVNKKAFVPLNDLLDKYAPTIKEMLNPALLDGPKVDGVMYALPTNKEIASVNGLFFRKDLVEKYDFNISKIKTVDDLENVLEPMLDVIKENEPGIHPYYSTGRGLSYITNFQAGPGPGTLDETGKIVYKMGAETTKCAEIAYRWNQKGLMNEDVLTASELVPNMFCTNLQYKPGKDAEVSAQLGVEFVGIPIGKVIIATSDVTGSMLAISRTSKNPERAMMLLNLLNTDKHLNNLLNYGIEDVHYVKVKDNVIDFLDGEDGKTCKYFPASQWMFQNQFLNYIRVGEAEDKFDQLLKFNEGAAPSPLIGFSFDTSNVKSELAACSNVNKEYQKAVLNGILDPKTAIPEYMNKLKKSGAEKIVAEKQKQVDEFLGK